MLEITDEDLNKTAYNNQKCPGPVHIHTFCDVIGICVRVQAVLDNSIGLRYDYTKSFLSQTIL